MRQQPFVLRVLEALIPLLVLALFFGGRFKRLPAYARDIYPFILWTLIGLVIAFGIIYLIGSIMVEPTLRTVLWSLVIAVAACVLVYLVGTTLEMPGPFSTWPLLVLGVVPGAITGLFGSKRFGQ